MASSDCSDGQLEQANGWILSIDVGLPAYQLFNMVYASILFMIVACVIHVIFLQNGIKGPTAEDSLLLRFGKSKEFWLRCTFLVLALALGLPNLESSCKSCSEGEKDNCGNWRLMFWYGLVLIITTNVSTRAAEFYLGEGLSLPQYARFFLKGKAPPSQEALESVIRTQGQQTEEGNVGFWTLMPSVFITWIFAKSIYNSAILGGMYGMWGGVAYASWYVSFFTAGTVCYMLRTRYGHKSMMTAIYKNYGATGTICYMVACLFRLFNEIWSNATVIGGFFGLPGSKGYWGACWLSTFIPAVYVLMGGMRASLFSDVFQAFFAVVFLVVVLATIGSDKTFLQNTDIFSYQPTSVYEKEGWYDDGWWTCFLGGLLQGVASYPFFDPVLTDRGFLGTPKTMLLSFYVGGFCAALFIILYAVIGIYGTFYHEYWALADVCGCKDGLATVASSACPSDWNPCSGLSSKPGDASYAAWVLGHQTFGAVEVFVTFIMITASMSTLDSTFTSWSKFVSLELGGWLKLDGDRRSYIGPLQPQDVDNISSTHMTMARCSILMLMVLGVSFLGTEKDAMTATSSAGTMVMGIGAPIWMMTIWRTKDGSRKGWVQAPLAFLAPSVVGFVFGYYYYSDAYEGEGPTYSIKMGSFYYSRFLGTNVWGHLACFIVFLVCFAFHQLLPGVWFYKLSEVEGGDSDAPIGLALPKEAESSKSSTGVEVAVKGVVETMGQL